jgi:uncharacterized protein (DUF934 family)
MPLLKDGKPVADTWHKIVNGEALPPDGPVVVPFERWRAERDTLLGRNTPLGVRLPNTQQVAELAPDLERLELIVLEFPKFIDGRAYSQARLLRERYGYRHELRATGNVLRDELLFMQRCGFDAFEIDDPKAVESWQAAINEINIFYQPAADDRTAVGELRRSAAKRDVSTR